MDKVNITNSTIGQMNESGDNVQVAARNSRKSCWEHLRSWYGLLMTTTAVVLAWYGLHLQFDVWFLGL